METIKKLLSERPDLIDPKVPWLELVKQDKKKIPRATGPHRVKLIRGEHSKKEDYKTKETVQGILLYFEEDGVEKKYFIPLLNKETGKFHYLIDRFSEIEEGNVLVMEYKRREGSVKGYIDVQLAQGEVKDDEIPIIDEATQRDIEPGENPPF